MSRREPLSWSYPNHITSVSPSVVAANPLKYSQISFERRLKLLLYYIGKPRDKHANAMAEEYIKRSTRFAKCEMREIHPDRFDLWTKYPSATKVFLDPAGRAMDSAGFISMVDKAEREGRDLVFLIGGSDGLPKDWRPRADVLLGLSSMTMPHELARVILAEQIYRALTTLRGHPYPR